MDTISVVKGLLAHTLQIGQRADAYTADSPLLGAIPELDSMAVVNLITAMEEQYGFVVHDDEINAEAFATLGSLARFVDQKLRQ
jgi:acyl carrier protein